MKQQENSPHPDDLRSGLSLVLLGNLLVVLASLLISLAVPASAQAGAVVAVSLELLSRILWLFYLYDSRRVLASGGGVSRDPDRRRGTGRSLPVPHWLWVDDTIKSDT